MSQGESEDRDLARAITLSLQDSAQPPSITPALCIDDDDDHDDEAARFQADLARAIAASKANASPATSIASLSSDQNPTDGVGNASTSASAVATTALSSTSSSFLAERAQLEQQRLARLKRSRGETDSHVTGPPSKRQASSSRELSGTPASEAGPSRREKERVDEEAEVFWDGELRQTANMHVSPGHNGTNGKAVFRLSEIIGDKREVQLAIISTYCLELSWIYTFFARDTPVVLVTQPAPTENGNATIKQVLPNWIRVTPFLRGGRGVMHIKFLLLFYRSRRLRIVISTANLIDHDWRDIENTVWVQDVPPLSSPIPHEPKVDDFPSTFEHVLRAVNVAPALTSLISTDHPNIPLSTVRPGALRTRWDFSRVRVTLVPSIAGKHEGWPVVVKSGHTALMRAISRLNPQQRGVSLEYQGSSIGTYSAAWLSEFVHSAKGCSPEALLNAPKSRRAATPMPSSNTLKILFPTRDWVRNTVLGEAGGGTMFCRKSQWEAVKFPRNLFHASRSRRGRVLMHSKMMIAKFHGPKSSPDKDSDSDLDPDIIEIKEDNDDNDDIVGYAYVGSHNFTPSAWGTLSGSGFTPILNVTNYELGIVFALKDEADVDRVACYQRPPTRYSSRDRPWMQEESEVLNGA